VSITLHIEALLFASDKPVTIKELLDCFDKTTDLNVSKKDIQDAIETISHKYESSEFAIQIKKIAEGYTFMTKPEFHNTIAEFLKLSSQKKLSTTALETLSIIAYKQPVTKSEMESIRGVNSDYTVQKLLEKELVVLVGRNEGPGRPLLYGTSKKFMNYFGLKTIADLPRIRDFQELENSIGDPETIEITDGK